MIEFKKLLHTSLLVSNVDRSAQFYHQILGFKVSASRPDLGFPGLWFEFGEQQLHLIELPNPDPIAGRPAHAGRDRHVAFSVSDINTLIMLLEKHKIPYTKSNSGRAAVFCRDPDGNGLEFIET